MAAPFVQDKNIPFITGASRKPITVPLCFLIRTGCNPQRASERASRVPIYGESLPNNFVDLIQFRKAKVKASPRNTIHYAKKKIGFYW